MKFYRIIGLLVCCLGLHGLWAQPGTANDPYESRTGTQLDPGSGFSIHDNEWNGTNSLGAWTNISCNDRIILSTDLDKVQPTTAYTVVMNLAITAYDANGAPSSHSRTLSISYNPQGGTTFPAKSYTRLIDAYKMDIQVVSVLIDGVAVDLSDPNAQYPHTPDYLMVEAEISVDRIRDFDRASLVSGFMIDASDPDFLNLSWGYMPGAESYELEWTFVDDYSDDPSQPYLSAVDYDFAEGATRINLTSTTYRMSRVFDHGYVIFRLRAVGREANQPEQAQNGNWSIAAVGNTSSLASQWRYHNTQPHESALNWQYVATYAIDDLKKEATSYMDATLQGRQAVSLLNTQNEAIASEQVLDAWRRPVINVLPSPMQNDALQYYPELHQVNDGGTIRPMNWRDIDNDNGNCVGITPPPLETTNGAGKYYSPANPDKAEQQAFVPDAKGYPYAQIEFTDDNTGRTRRQGGVGPDHQLGSDHESKFFYSDPSDAELELIFGPNEVGEAEHYKKVAVMDPNGQVSVSYIDMHGRTVATALAGKSPDNLITLDHNTGPVSFTDPLTEHNKPIEDGHGYEIRTEKMITAPSELELHYVLNGASFNIDCENTTTTFCYDCVYEFELSVQNDCGEEMLVGGEPITTLVGPFDNLDDVCASNETAFLDETYTTLQVPIGSYTIVKRLTVHLSSMYEYRQLYMNAADCFEDLEFYLDLYEQQVDLTGCDDDYCTMDCIDKLGLEEDWTDPTQTWQEAIDACKAECERDDYCEGLYLTMLQDIRPRGQYALYNVDANNDLYFTADPSDPNDPLTDCDPMLSFSLLNPTNDLLSELGTYNNVLGPYTYANSNLNYYNADGSPSTVTIVDLVTGVSNTYTPDELTPAQFVAYWQDSWEATLVEMHPNYCMWEWCTQTSDVNAWDQNILGLQTLPEVIDYNAANPNATPLLINGNEVNLIDADPFFALFPDFANDPGGMIDQMADYQGTGYSLWQIVYAYVHCPNADDQILLDECLENIVIDQLTGECTEDAEWIAYRSLYLGLRTQFVELAKQSKVCYGVAVPECKEDRYPTTETLIGGFDLNDPDILGQVNDQLNSGTGEAHCESTCAGYQLFWKEKLKECLSGNDLTAVLGHMKDICASGCSYDENPIGSQVTDDTSLPYQSFEELFVAYSIDSDILDASGNPNPNFNETCNIYLITMPPPPGATITGTQPTFPILDGCACDQLLTIRDQYDPNDPDLPDWVIDEPSFFAYKTGSVLPNYDQLSCDCDAAWKEAYGQDWPLGSSLWGTSANQILAALNRSIPAEFSCPPCKTCEEVQGVFNAYAPALLGADNELEILAGVLNREFGFNLTYPEYLDFIEDCEESQLNSPCTPQNRMDDLLFFLNEQIVLGTGQITGQEISLVNSLFATSNLYGEDPATCQPELNSVVLFARVFNVEILQIIPGQAGDWYLIGEQSNGKLMVAHQLANDLWEWTQEMTLPAGNAFVAETMKLLSTGDGGLVVGGVVEQNGTDRHYSLVKIDPAGSLSWNYYYPNAEFPQHTLGLFEQSTNHIVLAYGEAESLTHWKAHAVLVRLNSDGTINQQKSYPDLLDNLYTYETSQSTFQHLSLGANDEFYLGGLSEQEDGLSFLSFQADGTLDWSRRVFEIPFYCSDLVFTTAGLSDGNLAVLVRDSDNSGIQTRLFKLNQSGQIGWSRNLSVGVNTPFEPTYLAATKHQGLLISGLAIDPASTANMVGMKIGSANAELQWSRRFTGTGDRAMLHEREPGHYLLQKGTDRVDNLFENLSTGMPEVVCEAYPIKTGLTNTPLSTVSYDEFETNPNLGRLSLGLSLSGASSFQVTPQCSERLLMRITDECGTDCVVTLEMPASQDVHFATLDDLNTSSGVLGTGNTNTFTVSGSQNGQVVSIAGYNPCLNACDADLELCNTSIAIELTFEDPCAEYQFDLATHEAILAFDAYKNGLRDDFVKKYLETCLDPANLTETLDLTYDRHEYHYMLYYYDQGGSLVQTVPPAGAVIDGSGNHEKQTQYAYNTLGQLIWQHTLDGDESRFWYDELSRLVFSQNKKQEGGDWYSYVRFDELGRTYESGEVQHTGATFGSANPAGAPDGYLLDTEITLFWSATGLPIREQVVTTYDDPVVAVDPLFPGGQQNLRGRVAAITYTDVVGTTSPRDNASYYSYDIHGNVMDLITEIPHLAHLDQQFHHIHYDYDLLTGNLNLVSYQEGETDQFFHFYEYDADKRIRTVYTSRDQEIWHQDARYQFYDHGPLARTELADVQGIDYAYTIHGWLKGINSTVLDPDRDMGHDNQKPNPAGQVVPVNGKFARDAFGFNMGFYEGDYQPISQASQTPATEFIADVSTMYPANPVPAAVDPANTTLGEHWGGNIGHLVTTLRGKNGGSEQLLTAYQYDQLQRIQEMRAFTNENVMNLNAWTMPFNDQSYYATYTFDPDGNLETLQRNGTAADQLAMDNLSYTYDTRVIGGLPRQTNRLNYVHDAELDGNYDMDVDAQAANNYLYDEIGNLIKDVKEEIDEIEWSVTGKVREIRRDGNSKRPDQAFFYRPDGTRLANVVKHGPEEKDWSTTYYIRDAQGNVMATYTHEYAPEGGAGENPIDFANQAFVPYPFDAGNATTVGGTTVQLTPGARKVVQLNYPYTANTVLEFEFKVGSEGERHMIGLVPNSTGSAWGKLFHLYGTQPQGQSIQDPAIEKYDTPGAWKKYVIRLGDHYTGGNNVGNYLCFYHKENGAPIDNPSFYRNIRIYEDDDPEEDAFVERMLVNEHHLYGSKHLGIRNTREEVAHSTFTGGGFDPATGYFLSKTVVSLTTPTAPAIEDGIDVPLGLTTYSLSEHRGNVLATLSDRKLQAADAAYVSGVRFEPDVLMTKDYYPYGMEMMDRGFEGEGYHFGFQGQEQDEEFFGGAVSYKYRIHDPRIGRFLSIDPLAPKYPWYTPYQFSGNQVIHMVEVEGLEPDSYEKKSGADSESTTSNGEVNIPGSMQKSVVNEDGSTTTYIPEGMSINEAQEVFENPAEGLITPDNTEGYFTAVYGVRPFWWANYTFGGNRATVLQWFEEAGANTGIPPSELYVIAVGEGLRFNMHKTGYNMSMRVSSYHYLGLDFFATEAASLRAQGFLRSDFNSGDEYVPMTPFRRYEPADPPTGTMVYPASFSTWGYGIEGFASYYASSKSTAQDYATSLGWGTFSTDNSMFWSYVQFQSTNRNRNFQAIGQQDFTSYSNFTLRLGTGDIRSKAYNRYVTWRYIQYQQIFTR